MHHVRPHDWVLLRRRQHAGMYRGYPDPIREVGGGSAHPLLHGLRQEARPVPFLQGSAVVPPEVLARIGPELETRFHLEAERPQ